MKHLSIRIVVVVSCSLALSVLTLLMVSVLVNPKPLPVSSGPVGTVTTAADRIAQAAATSKVVPVRKLVDWSNSFLVPLFGDRSP